jgi:hypothetical protein
LFGTEHEKKLKSKSEKSKKSNFPFFLNTQINVQTIKREREREREIEKKQLFKKCIYFELKIKIHHDKMKNFIDKSIFLLQSLSKY